MELSRYEMAAIKRTAQVVKPMRAKLSKLADKISALNKEIEEINNEINLWENPIVTKYGYTSGDILSGRADEDIKFRKEHQYDESVMANCGFTSSPFDEIPEPVVEEIPTME